MFKICIILLSAAVIYSNAAVALFPYEEKPAEFAHREGCYLSSLHNVVPYDEPFTPYNDETCTQYKCSKSTNMVSLFSCGVVGIKPGCRSVSDSTKKYPECCPKEICD